MFFWMAMRPFFLRVSDSERFKLSFSVAEEVKHQSDDCAKR